MAKSKRSIGEKYHSPFAKALRHLMDEQDITQDRLAKETGKSRQTVSQYVNGISEPGYDTLAKIADYFGVSTDYLLGRSDIKTVDISAQAIIAYTGLSEENVTTLHNMASHIGRPAVSTENGEVILDGNQPFIDCLNDILEAFYCDRETIMRHYIRLRRASNNVEVDDRLSWVWYSESHPQAIPGFEFQSDDYGRDAALTKEFIEYDCMKIAKEVETKLKQKYLEEQSNSDQSIKKRHRNAAVPKAAEVLNNGND